MQIDFHHTATYVIARAAKFNHKDANIIAYCAQYVDDAVNDGIIVFNRGPMYKRISSAHKMLDYRNFKSLANRQVWLPFHFLPGNGGKKAGQNPKGKFINKIVCKPDSYIAKDMLRSCVREKKKNYGLHRLGITMHVYADTWAHQGFAGVSHSINEITRLDNLDKPHKGFLNKVGDFFGDTWDKTKSTFVGTASPLGHGPALTLPDQPWLRWSYRDSGGVKVQRDNTSEFLKAADAMYRAMRWYQLGRVSGDTKGLPPRYKRDLENMMRNTRSEKGEARHKKWLKAIEKGKFKFGPVKLSFIAKGKGSWKYQSIGDTKDIEEKRKKFSYDPSFLQSNWKLFHDALQDHRFTVIHNILPKYGICAA